MPETDLRTSGIHALYFRVYPKQVSSDIQCSLSVSITSPPGWSIKRPFQKLVMNLKLNLSTFIQTVRYFEWLFRQSSNKAFLLGSRRHSASCRRSRFLETGVSSCLTSDSSKLSRKLNFG